MYETALLTQEYVLKAYIIQFLLSDESIRVELVDLKKNKTKNIYNHYDEKEVTINWIDDYNVEINGHKSNVLKNKYDWRWNRR